MIWKLFNTPDVDPKTHPGQTHYQQYDTKHEHDVDAIAAAAKKK
jgi:hypothetical protein